MLREVAEAEDGPASVISTGLNLGLPLPDPAHTDTIWSCHRPPAHLCRRRKEKEYQSDTTQSSGPEGCCSEQSGTQAMETMKILDFWIKK